MTRTLLVRLAPASSLPGDEPVRIGPAEAEGTLVEPDGEGRVVVHGPVGVASRALTGPVRRDPSGVTIVEVVVDGWRFELEVEDAARAALRRRATRERDAAGTSGPTEIRAIIPGRVAAVRVEAGEAVEAGQSLLVIEAMKMQNELRAPRDGVVSSVAVGPGQTIEVGDLLLALQ